MIGSLEMSFALQIVSREGSLVQMTGAGQYSSFSKKTIKIPQCGWVE